MVKLVRRVLYRLVKVVLSKKNFTKFHFYNQHGYKLDFNNPETLSEKIQWIKYYGDLESLAEFVDKYEVRKYVKDKIGDEYLIPLIGVYENSNEIDFESLPNSFAIKATHGSGWNLIVKDKQEIDWNVEKNKIDKWINSSFYKLTGERNYKLIKGRVVVEELIQDPSGDLKDYKFFCFGGEPKYIQVDGDRYEGHKRDIYDLNWNKLDVKLKHDNLDRTVEKPKMLNDLIDLARKLASEFTFVRVDLYYTNERIYFGELTFTPGQGFEKITPTEYDKKFGEYWDLKGDSLIKDVTK